MIIIEKEKSIFDSKVLNETLEELNDVELVILAKNGNEQAIKILINKYRNLFFKIISKYCANNTNMDKEDLLSECYVSLYESVKKYEFNNSKIQFKTFLYYVIKKRIFLLLRNSNCQKRIKNYVELKENYNLICEDKKINEIEKKELIDKVKDKLSNLELKVLNLYLENYSYNEIENLLNVSKKSIDNSLKRVKTKIKEVVNNV